MSAAPVQEVGDDAFWLGRPPDNHRRRGRCGRDEPRAATGLRRPDLGERGRTTRRSRGPSTPACSASSGCGTRCRRRCWRCPTTWKANDSCPAILGWIAMQSKTES